MPSSNSYSDTSQVFKLLYNDERVVFPNIRRLAKSNRSRIGMTRLEDLDLVETKHHEKQFGKRDKKFEIIYKNFDSEYKS